MIRLVKKDGEYFLQERNYHVEVVDPWWVFWRHNLRIVYEDWRTAETVDLDREEET